MDIFISWSGERSKAVAELLKTWLKCVVQASKPWVSSQNISPGTVWFAQISERLNSSSIGIVCLTQENKNNPWILFEAGALAKGLADTRVCTFLIDLTTTDIQPPLSMFNATSPNREGLWMLVQQVNAGLKENSLDQDTLQAVFDTYWPQFEEGLRNALDNYPLGERQPERSPESLLTEILQTTRGLSSRIDRVESGMLDRVLSPTTWSSHDSRGLSSKEINDHLVNLYQARADGSVAIESVTPDQAAARGIPTDLLVKNARRPKP